LTQPYSAFIIKDQNWQKIFSDLFRFFSWWAMNIHRFTLIFMGFSAWNIIVGIAAKEEKPSEAGGILYRSVFYGETIPESTVNCFPEPLRGRLQAYGKRFTRFQSRLPDSPAGKDRTASYLLEKRRRVERAIATLIDQPGIELIASEYSQKAVLAYEWEGMSDGPLAEATFAENYLRNNADSPLRPYLQLFLAHRWKCARETLIMEKKKQQASTIQAKYQAQMILLRQDADPLVRAIAEDLDGEPAIYIDHPRLLAAELLLQPSPDGEAVPSMPTLSIQNALDLAIKTVEEKKLNVTGQFIHSVHYEYDEGKKLYPDGKNRRGFYWYVHWRWATPRLGGELSLRIFMDGEVIIERHGP
jgi:hypothetical protein